MEGKRKDLRFAIMLCLTVALLLDVGILVVPLVRQEYWIWRLEAAHEKGKRQAAGVLGRIGSGRSVSKLLDLHARGQLGEDAIGAVTNACRLRPGGAIPVLVHAMERGERELRESALVVVILAGHSGEAALPCLLAMAGDPKEPLRARAVHAIDACWSDEEKAHRFLLDCLKDPDKGVQYVAADCLVTKGRSVAEAFPILLEQILLHRKLKDSKSSHRDTWREIHYAARKDMAGLVRLFSHPDVTVRSEAAFMAGKVGPLSREATMALGGLVKDGDSGVRRNAIVALKSLGASAEPALPWLVEAIRGEDVDLACQAIEAAGALGSAGKAAVPFLGDSLRSKQSIIRLNAARVLGGIGPDAKAAAPRLKEHLDDTDEEVRKAAKEALAKVEGS